MKINIGRLIVSLAEIALLAPCAAAPARAEVFHICSVRETKDGFVALRAAPRKDAPVVAKMVPGQMTMLDVKNYKPVKSGNWVRLSWYPGETMPDPGEPGYDKVKRGWTSYELIDDCG